MKTKKLNLNDLKVESFVTSLESKDAQTIKGGVLHAVLATAPTGVLVSIGSAIVVISVSNAIIENVRKDDSADKVESDDKKNESKK